MARANRHYIAGYAWQVHVIKEKVAAKNGWYECLEEWPCGIKDIKSGKDLFGMELLFSGTKKTILGFKTPIAGMYKTE